MIWFLCEYLNQTFLRQKISLTSCGSNSVTGKECQGDSEIGVDAKSSMFSKCGGYGSCKHAKECNDGVLLYALHLRFVCPLPRKRSRAVHKCKSAEMRNIADIEDERRFYLYDDMRVVFPQRHSDADEGKVCASSFKEVTVNAFMALNSSSFYFYLMSHHLIMVFSPSTLQLLVEYHFPSDPKYFDVSS